MQFEPAFRQPGLERGLDRFRFVLSPAMNQPIICIPTPREIRVCPLDPKVERIMQEEVGEYRADHSPNAKGNFCFDRVTPLDRSYVVLDLRLKR